MREDERWTWNGIQGDVWPWLEAAHDLLFSAKNRRRFKHTIIFLSLFGFVAHLLLIFLAHSLGVPPAWIAALGGNYLSALSTPFNLILFYEVLTLIAALPASSTRSIASQYEIVSLIFIRDVFGDIAHAGDLVSGHRVTAETLPLFLHMWAGLAMYFLVVLFQHIALRHNSRSLAQVPSRETMRFIGQKKVVAASLAVLLVSMALWNLTIFAQTAIRILYGGPGTLESATSFYNDMFTVMIFTDVLVLILSLIVSDRYDMVFRNAGFVVSIVLIRFALTEGYPYGALLAIGAMLFGLLTLLIYHYSLHVNGPVDA